MNELDSKKLVLLLAKDGFEKTDDPLLADLILFNTCSIREKAYHKAMSDIGRASVFKNKKKSPVIGVCGCVAQQEKEKIISRFPHVDIVFGPDKLYDLPRLLEEVKAGNRPTSVEFINDPESYVFLDDTPTKTEGPTALVSIIKGCNCACSYCIVPKVRGKEVGRPANDVIAEVHRLVAVGIKEVMLLGQNVNSYKDLSKLIRRLSEETDIKRIRFMSPHPKDVKADIIEEYASNEKLCPHLHLPLQSGSNSVLKKMRRGYTREKYIEICKQLRAVRDGFQISSDIIVGFCGETEADFKDTLDLMREVEFDSTYSFKYSPRPGTEAAEKFEDDVSVEDKDRRLAELFSVEAEVSAKIRARMIGKTSQALIYEMDKMGRGLFTGRLPDNRIVHFAGNNVSIGDIVDVKITKVNKNSLSGEMIK